MDGRGYVAKTRTAGEISVYSYWRSAAAEMKAFWIQYRPASVEVCSAGSEPAVQINPAAAGAYRDCCQSGAAHRWPVVSRSGKRSQTLERQLVEPGLL